MPPTKAESTALLDKPVGAASWWRPLEPSLVVATANLLAAVWQETFLRSESARYRLIVEPAQAAAVRYAGSALLRPRWVGSTIF